MIRMKTDLRDNPLFKEVTEYWRAALEPAIGQISMAEELTMSADEQLVAFTGTRRLTLTGVPDKVVCVGEFSSGTIKVISASDGRLPAWAPDGKRLVYAIAAESAATALVIYDRESNNSRQLCTIPGVAEYLSWSPDGARILVGVAGARADVAATKGSGTYCAESNVEDNSWMPFVDDGTFDGKWRDAYVVEVASGESNCIKTELNIWEAAWCGNSAIIAIVSDIPSESAWYSARLVEIDLSGEYKERCLSEYQMALPAVSPSGEHIAYIEAICSDRTLAGGNVLLFRRDDKLSLTQTIDALGMDATYIAWRDNSKLFILGIRGTQTVACEYDVHSDTSTELWRTDETCGGLIPSAAVGRTAFAAVYHSYTRYPEIARIFNHPLQRIPLAHEGSEAIRKHGGTIQTVIWNSKDKTEMQGWLVTPDTPGPHPLMVLVHGGPVSAFRNAWSMMYIFTPLLARFGYAVFHPNPRGSIGRGIALTEQVIGDMGGHDANDILTGIDHLIAKGLVDPQRVGVMGRSYGGFMASWLVTQTDRFAAAISMAPVNNWYSQHFTSNIAAFDELFLDDVPRSRGEYFNRSPVFFAERVKTPVLHMAGSGDRCTPSSQAMEFHNALVDEGVESVCVIYPGEGHHVSNLNAQIDQCTRILWWLHVHMPSNVLATAT
jgi:dipeptidyl aminopeptidase/acylaminoacyl peptidase